MGKTWRLITVVRCACSCRGCTRTRVRSGSMAWSLCSRTSPVSGSGVATIIALIRGKRSGTGNTVEFALNPPGKLYFISEENLCRRKDEQERSIYRPWRPTFCGCASSTAGRDAQTPWCSGVLVATAFERLFVLYTFFWVNIARRSVVTTPVPQFLLLRGAFAVSGDCDCTDLGYWTCSLIRTYEYGNSCLFLYPCFSRPEVYHLGYYTSHFSKPEPYHLGCCIADCAVLLFRGYYCPDYWPALIC